MTIKQTTQPDAEPAPAKLAYSIDEAGTQISCGRSTVYAEIKAGRLRACKLRNRTVILAEDLRAFLRSLGSTA